VADQVRFLPVDLVAKTSRSVLSVPDEHEAQMIARLVEEAYSRGYHDGYIRGATEENSWNEYREQHRRKAMKPATSTEPKEVPGA
jgi:hypothetical protein